MKSHFGSFSSIIYLVSTFFFRKTYRYRRRRRWHRHFIRDRHMFMTFESYVSKKDAAAVRGELFQQAPADTNQKQLGGKKNGEATGRHTIGNTCSCLSTRHSISIGLEPSCSKNSFILAGSSSAE